MNKPKTGHCAVCYIQGYQCDTSAGEVIDRNGEIVAVAPKGSTILMIGDRNGNRTDKYLCDVCAQYTKEL